MPIARHQKHRLTSSHAISLDKWGSYFFVFSFFMAIIVLIANGFQTTISRYGYEQTEFVVEAMFSIPTIISFLSWIVGGFAFKLILQSFSIVVEASYRSMMKD